MCIYPLIIYINVFICVYKYLCAHIYIYIIARVEHSIPLVPTVRGQAANRYHVGHILCRSQSGPDKQAHTKSQKKVPFLGFRKSSLKRKKGTSYLGYIYIYYSLHQGRGVTYIYIYPSIQLGPRIDFQSFWRLNI